MRTGSDLIVDIYFSSSVCLSSFDSSFDISYPFFKKLVLLLLVARLPLEPVYSLISSLIGTDDLFRFMNTFCFCGGLGAMLVAVRGVVDTL